MTEEQLTGLTKQLQDMHFDAQTIQTVLAKSDTTMQLANHLQALVAGAADKSMINAETMKESFTSDNTCSISRILSGSDIYAVSSSVIPDNACIIACEYAFSMLHPLSHL